MKLKKANRFIKFLILFSINLFVFVPLFAQIYFINPSFEGTKPGHGYRIPNGWHLYAGFPALLPDSSYWVDRTYKKAYDGLTYMEFDSEYWSASSDTIRDAIYQTLPFNLNAGINYSFSFYALSVTYYEPKALRGGISIWLADKLLHKIQLIYRVFPLDTNWWQKYYVSFKPIQELGNFIIEGYEPESSNNITIAGCIDYLSPITFNNKDYIKAKASETVLTDIKLVQLSCTTIKDSGVTYTWRSEPPGFNSTDSSPMVYPKQTTKYIVTAHFSCGLDVSDTVQVNVLPEDKVPEPGGIDPNRGELIIQQKRCNGQM